MKKLKLISLIATVFLSCCSYNVEPFVLKNNNIINNQLKKGSVDNDGNLYILLENNKMSSVIKIDSNNYVSNYPNIKESEIYKNNYNANNIISNGKDIYINYYLKNKDEDNLGIVFSYKILKISNNYKLDLIDYSYIVKPCGFDNGNNLYFYGKTSTAKSMGRYSFWKLDEKNNLEEINFHGFEQGGSYSNCFGFDKKTNEILYYDFREGAADIPVWIFDKQAPDIYKKYRLNVKTLEKRPFEIDSMNIEFDSDGNIYYFKDSKVYKALIKDQYKTNTEIASFVGISKLDANLTLDEKRKILYVYGFGDNNQIFKVKI